MSSFVIGILFRGWLIQEHAIFLWLKDVVAQL